MSTLRDRPLRLESSLTRDYINRAQKMAEIEAKCNEMARHPDKVMAGWVLVGILLLFILMAI